MIVQQFKLYPDCHWLYFELFVHHSRPAMLKALTDCGTDFDGICRSWVTIFSKKKDGPFHMISNPKIGEIHLFKRKATYRIIAHEICHAVHHYFWVRIRSNFQKLMRSSSNNIDCVADKEEAFCFVMGELTRQFYCNWGAKRPVQKIKQKVLYPIPRGTSIKPTEKAKRFTE